MIALTHLAFTWVGYPAWLAVLSLGKPKPTLTPTPTPTPSPVATRIAIIVVVHNEAANIARRVAELEALHLPAGCALEIIVVDDGSDDDTVARIAITRGEVLRITHAGKAMGLMRGVERTNADVLVFADVRQQIPADALVHLLAPFGDPAIGCVSGVVHKPATGPAGWYWRYESWLRRMESRTGSTIGATGPWYAIRRELFVPPPRGLLLDDVWIPMQAAFAGARVVVAEDAIVFDVEHAATTEGQKKARTLTGNLQLLSTWPALLNPRKNPLWGRYVAHKVARLFTPFSVAALANGPLAPVTAVVVAAAAFEVGPARSAVQMYLASLEAWRRWLRRDYRW